MSSRKLLLPVPGPWVGSRPISGRCRPACHAGGRTAAQARERPARRSPARSRPPGRRPSGGPTTRRWSMAVVAGCAAASGSCDRPGYRGQATSGRLRTTPDPSAEVSAGAGRGEHRAHPAGSGSHCRSPRCRGLACTGMAPDAVLTTLARPTPSLAPCRCGGPWLWWPRAFQEAPRGARRTGLRGRLVWSATLRT
jgi:hypothetical protein